MSTDQPRFWATRSVLNAHEPPRAIVRFDEMQYAVRGEIPAARSDDWTEVANALERWPNLASFFEIAPGIEFDLSTRQPTGRSTHQLAADTEVFVSVALVDGSEGPRWVARDRDGDWFFALERPPVDDPKLWTLSHAGHLTDSFPELAAGEVVELRPGQTATRRSDGRWEFR